MKKLSLNQKLALVALILGFIALFAGDPYKGNHLTVDSKELDLLISRGADNIKPEELADWIIQGRAGFRMVDIRNEKNFSEYNIPNSDNIPVAELGKSDLTKTENIILICGDGTKSSQAWTLLKAKGYKGVYVLQGGLNEWKKTVLFPSVPENATPEQISAFEKAKEVSRYFGGTPQTGATEVNKETPKLEAPKLQAPANQPPKTSEPKKKKEGC